MSNLQQYTVGLVIYPGMTTLDIVGPQAVFSALPDIKVHRIWKALEPIEGDDGMVVFQIQPFQTARLWTYSVSVVA